MLRRSTALLFAEYVPKWASHEVSDSSNPHSVTRNFRRTEMDAREADEEQQSKGFFYLPRLDYNITQGVAPLFSKKQFDVQYHVLHRDAVDRLNTHTLGTELEGHNLNVVLRRTSFDATNAVAHAAAAEHFNYCFWYKSIRPWGTSVPKELREELQLQYGSSGDVDAMEEVQRRMRVTALSQQERCGWVYLVWTGKAFDILAFRHGTCPISSDLIPLLCLNVHESAMCVDYDVDGPEGMNQYVRNFWKTCNWELAGRYFMSAVRKE